MDPGMRVRSLQQQTLWPCIHTKARAVFVYLRLLLIGVTLCLSASLCPTAAVVLTSLALFTWLQLTGKAAAQNVPQWNASELSEYQLKHSR